MQLDKYLRTGRLYTHADEGNPARRTWRSRIEEKNVDVIGDGSTFAPYAIAGTSLRFATYF